MEMQEEAKVRKKKKSEPTPVSPDAREDTNDGGDDLKLKGKSRKETAKRDSYAEQKVEAVVDSNTEPTLPDADPEELHAAKRKKNRRIENSSDIVSPVDIPEFDQSGKQDPKKRKRLKASQGSSDTVEVADGHSNSLAKLEQSSHVKAKKIKKRGGPNNNVNEKRTTKGTKELCLAYLRAFGSSKWKYCKKQQHWLISNAFDESLLSEDDFLLFLRYIENMKGHARERLQGLASKFLEDFCSEGDEDEPSVQYERARSVLQMLV